MERYERPESSMGSFVRRRVEYLVGAAVRADLDAGAHSAQTDIEAVMEAADVIRKDYVDVMERYERPESSMGSFVRRRVVRNWEYLVGAAVQADLDAGAHSAQTHIEAVDHSAQTYIEAVMEAADVIRKDYVDVARILYEYAYELAHQLDPSSEGRCVLQFSSSSSALTAVLVRKGRGHSDRSKDFWVISDYIGKLKEDIANLEAEEQAAPEVRAPKGENPSIQAWRTKKLRRFHEILHILMACRAEREVGSIGANNPFLHFSELFITDVGVVSSREQPPLEVIKTTIATFSMLHDEILARDLEQILCANTPIKKSGFSKIISGLYGRITSRNVHKTMSSMPMVQKLLNLCVGEVQNSLEYLRRGGAGVAYVMNLKQCYLLVAVLRAMEESLASIDQSQLLDVNPILVLGELLQTFHEAQMLIEASCITEIHSHWPREAFEQGDMNHTFSRVLYDLEWHKSVLLNTVADDISQNHGVRLEYLIKHDGGLGVEVETALQEAMERDKESLKHRLKSIKVANPMEEGLAHQLLHRMEAPSSDLVFLNPVNFDHHGAPLIGSGGYGTVVRTNFLGRQCAMKVIQGGRGTGVNLAFEKEMDAVKKLGNHPHLVRLYCYSKTNDACYLIMEELQMDLEKVLCLKDKNSNRLSMVEVVALMLQIGEGLKHIHSMGAAHRDLKPGNILVNLADPSRKHLSRIRSVKIADFGLTKTQAAVVTCSNHTRNRGTSVYMAPEVIDLGKDDTGTRFNPAKADVFSFGVVCSEILTGETPYGGHLSKQMKEQVKAGTLRPNLPTECPPQLATLIKRCWAGNYGERPLLPEICKELRYIKGLLLMYMDKARQRSIG